MRINAIFVKKSIKVHFTTSNIVNYGEIYKISYDDKDYFIQVTKIEVDDVDFYVTAKELINKHKMSDVQDIRNFIGRKLELISE